MYTQTKANFKREIKGFPPFFSFDSGHGKYTCYKTDFWFQISLKGEKELYKYCGRLDMQVLLVNAESAGYITHDQTLSVQNIVMPDVILIDRTGSDSYYSSLDELLAANNLVVESVNQYNHVYFTDKNYVAYTPFV